MQKCFASGNLVVSNGPTAAGENGRVVAQIVPVDALPCAPLPSRVPRMTSRTAVTLPNFFRSFLKPEPRVNPHYHAVKAVSEEWLAVKCSFSAAMRRKVGVCDFSYFCSIAAPEAPKKKLRTVCDWGNWVSNRPHIID